MRDYYNWENKEERAEIAKKHTNEMKEKYADAIQNSISHTTIWNDTDLPKNFATRCTPFDVQMVCMGSVDAAFEYGRDKTAILNFSSHKNAGGMFLNGSRAQEECLCHESTLYNVLKEFDETFYAINRLNLNNALYINRGLYSEDVKFIHNGEEKSFDVVTCACPNKKAAQKYKNVPDSQNSYYLKERIRFVLDMAEANKVKTFILGAYGCGVFGQNPNEVISIFLSEITRNNRGVELFVFAVPDENSENYKAFYTAIKEYNDSGDN